MCKVDERISEEFNWLVQNIFEKVDASEWRESMFRPQAIHQLALATIPDQYEWTIETSIGGNSVNFMLLGYTPTLEEIINVH